MQIQENINILLSQADWQWSQAVANIFRPRGINSLVINNPCDAVDMLEKRRVHTAIVDMDNKRGNGLAMIKMLKSRYPLLPCILLASRVENRLLEKALELEVFCVIEKPFDLSVLTDQLNRLFLKRFNITIFSQNNN